MSAFICDYKTISCIAEAFFDYGVTLDDGKYHPIEIIVNRMDKVNQYGQALLDQNYRSVNYRYQEDTEIPQFEFSEVNWDEGTVLGCIACYEYQACETTDYFDSPIHKSICNLKDALLMTLLRRNGMKMPYGYGGHDMLEG